MKKILCPACGGETKRNGKTSSGATRWRCKSCGASTTQRYDNSSKLLKLFADWLLAKKTQSEMGMSARTFRRQTARFWKLWPLAPRIFFLPLDSGVAPTTSYAVAAFFPKDIEYGIKSVQMGGGRTVAPEIRVS